MAKRLIISVLFLSFSLFCSAQDNTTRIKEIRAMYSEAIQLYKLTDTVNECKTGKKINYEGFDSKSEKYPFEQAAKKCSLSKGYVVLTGSFTGYEWGANTVFYYKDNELFFVFADVGSESCFSEYRIYYDKTGSAIKILEKSNECSGNELTKNIEIIEPSAKKALIETINKDHTSILEMLNGN